MWETAQGCAAPDNDERGFEEVREGLGRAAEWPTAKKKRGERWKG